MKKYLVVIDMQNDFLTGSLGNKECAATLTPVKNLIASKDWDRVYFTRDTHMSDYGETLEGKKLPVPHCLKFSHGWEIADGLVSMLPPEKVRVVDKKTFGSEDLGFMIPSDDDLIVVCGVCTSICVLTNAAIIRTQNPNARIVIPEEATADVTPEMKVHALECLKSIQCDVVKTVNDVE